MKNNTDNANDGDNIDNTEKKSVMPDLKKQQDKQLKKREKLKKFLDEQLENTWFDAKSGVHLVRKGDVIASDRGYLKGLTYPLRKLTKNKSHMSEVVFQLDAQIKYQRSVQKWGPLAGQKAGTIVSSADVHWLVSSSPKLIQPVKGDFPHMKKLIETMAPTEAGQLAIHSWLRAQLNAIMNGRHSTCPMLILAGGADDGKSFFMLLSTILRGNRQINPINVWTDKGPLWNDHLLGVECLNIDDSVASKTYLSRVSLNHKFKEAVFAQQISIDKRNHTGFSINPRPVWGVMMCVNASGEAIKVVPAMCEEDDWDKYIVIRTHRAEIYLRGEKGNADAERMDAYVKELPGYAHWLLHEFDLPEDLPEGCVAMRSGCLVYRDPDAMVVLDAQNPTGQLEQVIKEVVLRAYDDKYTLWGEPKLAATLIRQLQLHTGEQFQNDYRVPTSVEKAGKYLSKIAKDGGCIEDAGMHRSGSKLWRIKVETILNDEELKKMGRPEKS